MIIKNGSATTTQGLAMGLVVGVTAPRPWAATGSYPVDRLLTWAIVDQRAGNERGGLFEQEAAVDASMRGRVYHQARRSTDGIGKVEEIAGVGCRIDVSKGGIGGAVSDVADAVWAAMSSSALADVLKERAAAGRGPDGWTWPTRRSWPRLGWVKEDVEGVTVWEGKRTTGMATPVVIVDRAEIERVRDDYRAWWDALAMVAWELGRLNLGFAVLDPAADRQPWLRKC